MKNTIKYLVLASLAVLCTTASALVVSNVTPTNITTTSAWVNAYLISTNASTAAVTVTLYYATSDSSTNFSWAYTSPVGVQVVGSISTQIQSLTRANKYYFRWYAVQGTGTAWSVDGTDNFWTKPTSPTSTPTVITISVQADTYGNLKSPTNLWGANKTNINNALYGLVATGNPVYVETDSIALARIGPLETNLAGVSNIAIRVGPLETNLVGLSNIVVIATQQLYGVSQHVDWVDSSLDSVSGHVDWVDSSLDGLSNLFVTATQQLYGVSQRVVVAEGTITSNSAATNALNIRMTAAEGTIISNSAATNALDLRVDAIEANRVITNTIVAWGVTYTFTNAPAAANYILEFDPTTSNAWFSAKSSAGTYNHPSLTNQNGDTNFMHMTDSQFKIATNINLSAKSNDAGFVTAGVTNDLGSSFTNHIVDGGTPKHLTADQKTFATSSIAIHAGTNVNIRVEGTNIYFDYIYTYAWIPTNSAVAGSNIIFRVDENTNINVSVSPVLTNISAIHMTGNILMGTNGVALGTNIILYGGMLNGTNGIYGYVKDINSNYWFLFP